MENNHYDPRNQKSPDGERPKGYVWPALIITLALVLLFSWVYNSVVSSQYKQTTYDEFRAAMDAGQLAEVEIQEERGQLLYMTKEEAAKDPQQQQACYTGLPNGDHTELMDTLYEMGVTVNEEIEEDNSMIMMVLYYVLMFSVLFFFMRNLTRRMGGDGMMGNFGKSKARVYMESRPASPSRTWPARTKPRNPSRRSLTSSTTPKSTPTSVPSCPRALCWWAPPAPARP